MKGRITLFLALLCAYTLTAQVSTLPTITYSPSNPVVGDVVSFSIEFASISCDYSVDPDADEATVVLQSFPGAVHTYTATGTYKVNLDEDCGSEDLADKGRSTKALVLDSSWRLLDSDGVESTDKTITIGAATGPPSATVPTLGEWSLIILLISLVIFGVVYINQKSSNHITA